MDANKTSRYETKPEPSVPGTADSEKPFAEEGYALMGAAFAVHKEIGGGLLEEIYQECMKLELELRGLPCNPKAELPVFYKSHQLRKRYIPDLIVHDHIVVELKSVQKLAPEHEAQLINYMRITRQPVGYLINFGPIGKLEWKRIVLSEYAMTGLKPPVFTSARN